MPHRNLFSFMYLSYLVVGTVFLAVVICVLIWLCLGRLRRGRSARRLLGQEFVWTLVPALLVVGLTVLSEIPRGWGKATAGRAAPRWDAARCDDAGGVTGCRVATSDSIRSGDGNGRFPH